MACPERTKLALVLFSTTRPGSELSTLLLELSDESRARAARYRSQSSRSNLICGHSVLRRALVELGEDPAAVVQAQNGRPHLPNSPLEFNLSHSHEQGALLVGRHQSLRLALGVDLEWVGRSLDFERLARRFFTSREIEFIGQDPNLFFWVWTRKEAVLKSSGIGLRKALDSFDVLDNDVPAEATGQRLQLETMPLPGGYLLSWALPYQGPVGSSGPSLLQLDESDQDWSQRLRSHLVGRPSPSSPEDGFHPS